MYNMSHDDEISLLCLPYVAYYLKRSIAIINFSSQVLKVDINWFSFNSNHRPLTLSYQSIVNECELIR